MISPITKSLIESAALTIPNECCASILHANKFVHPHGPDISPDSAAPLIKLSGLKRRPVHGSSRLRSSYSEVVPVSKLRDTIDLLDPPPSGQQKALRNVKDGIHRVVKGS